MINSILGKLLAPVQVILDTIRACVIAKMRFRGKEALLLYDLIMQKGSSFALLEEVVHGELPRVYSAFVWIFGVPGYFYIEERLLRAGYTSTDSIAVITVLRVHKKRILKYLHDAEKPDKTLPVYILNSWDASKIGELSIDSNNLPTPYLVKEDYHDIETEVTEIISGKKEKTGLILYGPPGNGKTYLIRYLALKYKLPIFVASFIPDMDNHAVIRMFAKAKGPCIVLIEDFDNYFNRRRCLVKDFKFTMDTLLNVLDGVFCTPKQLIFCMTVNNINKVDNAFKRRPSRFKFVKKIDNPSAEVMDIILSRHNDIQDKDKKRYMASGKWKRKNLDGILLDLVNISK